MSINLRDTGNEIGLACAKVLMLSSTTLIGSLIVSGAVAVAGEFSGFKAPHRVAKMSAILMGASAAGCILGAWMSGAVGKDERSSQREYLAKEWQQKDELARDFTEAEKNLARSAIEARDKEIYRRGEQDLRNCHKHWRCYALPCTKKLDQTHENIRSFQLLN